MIPLGAVPALVVVAAVFGAALIGAVVQSFQPSSLVGGGLSAGAWRTVLGDRDLWDAVSFTGRVAALTTLLSAAGGVLLAAMLRGARPGVRALVALPLALPHLVLAVAVVAWLGPGGLVDRATGLQPDIVGGRSGLGIVLVSVLKEAPFVALAALAVWDDETRRREEAAAMLGAGPARRLLFVALPRLAPAVAVASLIVAAYSLGAFEVALIAGPTHPETIATYALDQTRAPEVGAPARAAVALLLAAALSLVAAAASVRLLRGRHV